MLPPAVDITSFLILVILWVCSQNCEFILHFPGTWMLNIFSGAYWSSLHLIFWNISLNYWLIFFKSRIVFRTSLVIKWLRLRAPNAGAMGSPGWEIKITYASQKTPTQKTPKTPRVFSYYWVIRVHYIFCIQGLSHTSCE